MIGQTVSHYKILQLLGRGAMGVAYKAQDLRLDRPLALEFLPSVFALDSKARQRFDHDAKAASAEAHASRYSVHVII